MKIVSFDPVILYRFEKHRIYTTLLMTDYATYYDWKGQRGLRDR